jgi:predicted negative regulator of RcsB-dependent stress response
MAKKKATRKELLKKPDEFLTFSAKAVIFFSEHSRLLTYFGVAVAIAVLVYLGIHTYMGYINKKGQNAYNIAYQTFVKSMSPDVEQKDFKESEKLFQQVRDKYGLSKVGPLALPELAYLKFLEKKYDEAIPLYQEFLNEVSDNPSYQSLARISLAACYEAKGEVKQAIEMLKQIMAGPDDHFKEQAMLSLARAYRLDHRPDKSKEILEEFVDKFKSSPFLPLAKADLNKFH